MNNVLKSIFITFFLTLECFICASSNLTPLQSYMILKDNLFQNDWWRYIFYYAEVDDSDERSNGPETLTATMYVCMSPWANTTQNHNVYKIKISSGICSINLIATNQDMPWNTNFYMYADACSKASEVVLENFCEDRWNQIYMYVKEIDDQMCDIVICKDDDAVYEKMIIQLDRYNWQKSTLIEREDIYEFDNLGYEQMLYPIEINNVKTSITETCMPAEPRIYNMKA